MHLETTTRTILHGHLFCGIGAGAKGFNKGHARVGNMRARFECVGGIDNDPAACRDFGRIVGVPASCIDLFSQEQYQAFHGSAPPPGWRQAVPDDIRAAFGYRSPHIGFLSAPCKGFSGLLSETQSLTDKYQALNGLTLRGVWLFLEAHKDDPVELVVFENVPRIATRGRALLEQIIALLRSYGYAVAETTHDCGELGRLGQSRKRFLLVARHMAKVPPFLYEPVKHPLRGVGEILEQLPMPLSGLGGPMHRMPALQWKTWVRLAFVRAGADWRSLNDLAVENGMLRDFGIVPGADYHNGAYGVKRWEDSAGTVTSNGRPASGPFSVADPRPIFDNKFVHNTQLGVGKWDQPASTVRGGRSPGQGRFAVADPRVDGHPKSVQLGVRPWNQPAGVVTGKMFVGGGPNAVADPRLDGKRFNTTFRVVEWRETSPAVAGPGGPAGGLGVADPRPRGGGFGKYRVTRMDESAGTVISGSTTGQGAFAVADPRPTHGPNAHTSKMAVNAWDDPGRAVTGSDRVGSGAPSVADPRPAFVREGRDVYQTAGHYGVVPWGDHSRAIFGHGQHDNGFNSVADPRVEQQDRASEEESQQLPNPTDRLVCVIMARDNTWHRPFTTLELAALQGLVDPDEQFELDGLSDASWRERIGNCVPPPSAEAIASVMGETLLLAWSGQTFTLSSQPIWVRNVAVALSVKPDEAAYD